MPRKDCTKSCQRLNLRSNFDRLGQLGSRLIEVAPEPERPCKEEMRIPVAGIRSERFPEEIDRDLHDPEAGGTDLIPECDFRPNDRGGLARSPFPLLAIQPPVGRGTLTLGQDRICARFISVDAQSPSRFCSRLGESALTVRITPPVRLGAVGIAFQCFPE